MISNLRGNEKSDEIAMTENPGRWFGIRENQVPKITQLLQLFWPDPKKVDFGQKLGGNIRPLDAHRSPKKFPALRDQEPVALVCW